MEGVVGKILELTLPVYGNDLESETMNDPAQTAKFQQIEASVRPSAARRRSARSGEATERPT